jgi:YMGG-like Gly-zipper
MHLSPLKMALRLCAALILLALPVVAQTAMLEGSAPNPAVTPASTVQLQAQQAQFDSRPAYQSGNVTESQVRGTADSSAALRAGVPAGIAAGALNNVPPAAFNGLRSGSTSTVPSGAGNGLRGGTTSTVPIGAVNGLRGGTTGTVPGAKSFRTGTANNVTIPNHDHVRPNTAVGIRPAPVRTVYVKDERTFWQKHPMVKGATIGAGVGLGAGALTGLVTRQGVLRGAVIGAGAGAGVGALRQSKIMKRHPIAKDVATGAVAGLGLGWAGSRWPHTVAATTGVGAAIGLGAGLLTHLR